MLWLLDHPMIAYVTKKKTTIDVDVICDLIAFSSGIVQEMALAQLKLMPIQGGHRIKAIGALLEYCLNQGPLLHDAILIMTPILEAVSFPHLKQIASLSCKIIDINCLNLAKNFTKNPDFVSAFLSCLNLGAILECDNLALKQEYFKWMALLFASRKSDQ